MTTFELRKAEEVKSGKLTFYKLVIDGKCPYDEFCTEIEEGNMHVSKLNNIRSYMNFYAQDDTMRFPSTKFRSIKQKHKIVGYEFKSGILRVYLMKMNPDMIIVLGGYKASQEKDIKVFSKIAEQYQSQINNISL